MELANEKPNTSLFQYTEKELKEILNNSEQKILSTLFFWITAILITSLVLTFI